MVKHHVCEISGVGMSFGRTHCGLNFMKQCHEMRFLAQLPKLYSKIYWKGGHMYSNIGRKGLMLAWTAHLKHVYKLNAKVREHQKMVLSNKKYFPFLISLQCTSFLVNSATKQKMLGNENFFSRFCKTCCTSFSVTFENFLIVFIISSVFRGFYVKPYDFYGH